MVQYTPLRFMWLTLSLITLCFAAQDDYHPRSETLAALETERGDAAARLSFLQEDIRRLETRSKGVEDEIAHLDTRIATVKAAQAPNEPPADQGFQPGCPVRGKWRADLEHKSQPNPAPEGRQYQNDLRKANNTPRPMRVRADPTSKDHEQKTQKLLRPLEYHEQEYCEAPKVRLVRGTRQEDGWVRFPSRQSAVRAVLWATGQRTTKAAKKKVLNKVRTRSRENGGRARYGGFDFMRVDAEGEP